MTRPRLRVAGTVLSCPDPRSLATFYERLLGWPRLADEPDWVVLRAGPTHHGLSFHVDESFEPPVWPSAPGRQQMQFHLDVATDDLEGAVQFARELGATVADWQPQADVRVVLDPVGHPFCLFVSDDWD